MLLGAGTHPRASRQHPPPSRSRSARRKTGEPLLRDTLTERRTRTSPPGRGAVEGVELGVKRLLIYVKEDLFELRASVPLADLGELGAEERRPRHALRGTQAASESFARSGAVVTIAYAGGLDALAGAISVSGSSWLRRTGNGTCAAGGLGAYQPPSPNRRRRRAPPGTTPPT